MTKVVIKDDFDLLKIVESGQCFRARKLKDGGSVFITKDAVLYIEDEGDGHFSVSCTEEEWERIWTGYFDLGRNYQEIRERHYGKHPFADEAIVFSKGIRVLRQDPWETLVTFIISQRKSIPSIRSAVDRLCTTFGKPLGTPDEEWFSFPSPEELSGQDLGPCGLGYRTKYVLDAVRRVSSGQTVLDSLSELPDCELVSSLKEIDGVGDKVANCVSLFAYGRTACVPVDVWIERAVREDCSGEDPFAVFGEDAGIIQQYMFYYKRNRP